MQTDGPTTPNLPRYEPGAPHEPEEVPVWPERRPGGPRLFAHDGPRFSDVNSWILGASLFANVALIVALLSVLVLAHAGYLAPGGPSPKAAASGPAISTPTATAAATSTPLSNGWLQVAPTSVHLSCNGDQQTQSVTLQNTGPQDVRWQVDFSVPADQAAIIIFPNRGRLQAGSSVTLQVQINTHFGSSQGGSGQQGIVSFAPSIPDAGTPPTLSYTTDSCNN